MRSQTTATFEEIPLEANSYRKSALPDSFWLSGNIIAPNNYTDAGTFDFWDGWALSSLTDTLDGSFQNEGSVISGIGYNGSSNYVVSYAPEGLGSYLLLNDEARGGFVRSLRINNTTYAYRTILDGNAFSKKFGGESGDDADYFSVVIRGVVDGIAQHNGIEFFLADYRFEDNTQDYIINEWTEINLESLGNVDGLYFEMKSTDVGQFGINTPTYFCVDNIVTADMPVSTLEESTFRFTLAPNPTTGDLVVQHKDQLPVQIISTNGVVITEGNTNEYFQLSDLSSGIYLVRVQNQIERLVKL